MLRRMMINMIFQNDKYSDKVVFAMFDGSCVLLGPSARALEAYHLLEVVAGHFMLQFE